MRRLELSQRDDRHIELSHGHWDHGTRMNGLVARAGAPSMAVLLHPEFWTPAPHRVPRARPVELAHDEQGARCEGAGVEIVEQRRPSSLLDGSRR